MFRNLFSKLNRISYTSMTILGFIHTSHQRNQSWAQVEQVDEGSQLPIYRKSEISQHKSMKNRVWVTYQDGVYDITDFVKNHPGGQDKILLAAGMAVEPFWQIYQQHYNSKLPLEYLKPLRIGTLHQDDLKENEGSLDASDPYKNDPKYSPILFVHQSKPVNAEPPRTLLTESWITPGDMWFIRNHHPVPQLDVKEYTLKLSSTLSPTLPSNLDSTFTFDDLKSKFPTYSITSTIQCGGNRRLEMNSIGMTAGSPWDVGAISTAEWKGVKLCDLLKHFGITYDTYKDFGIKHVQFSSTDGLEASIPIRKAIDPDGDVLVAYEMNGKDIPKAHGYPIRLVVPGHVGVRNVKWLSKITLSDQESDGPWQRGMAYKGLPPSATSLEGINVEKIQSLQEQPVQSVITFPSDGSGLVKGVSNTIKGYAYSGGGKGIVRVDVSINGGETWDTATLTKGSEQPMDKAWAWTFWEYEVDIPESFESSDLEIICKATDATYNVQPSDIKSIWNLRGINNNAWHKSKFKLLDDVE